MSPEDRPPWVVVGPTSDHVYTFIFLHDLGSSGDMFGQEFLKTSRCSDGRKFTEIFPGAKFIFPTAQPGHSSARNRDNLTQWFDIVSLDDPWHQESKQIKGLADSCEEIHSLVKEEAQKVPYGNVILGGLGQGSAMALSCLLTLDSPVGGFIGMSGWLPLQSNLRRAVESEYKTGREISPSRSDADYCFPGAVVNVVNSYRDELCVPSFEKSTKAKTSIYTPVFLGHGDSDETTRSYYGEAAFRTLALIGYEVTWKRYKNQGHWYKIPDAIDDMVKFIQNEVGWDLMTDS
ncbi:acyl-protein thioesterase [Biscogniauxia marginata]|nr:acyl-protein thioesterase [Biscogniauxia marginata]